jgi:mannose-6-phosphate isomerase
MPLYYPEDWIASVVEAYNPGMDKIEYEGLARCEDGTFLRDYIKSNPQCLGDKTEIGILVKLLDAGDRLAIQCHPTDKFAQEYMNSPYGKTECWYMLETTEDACVYLGFNEKATREKWVSAFHKQDVDAMLDMMHKIDVKQGDCIFVDGGIPHSIGEGCFMVELQQPTDLMVVTERVTTSGRVLPEEKLHNGLGFEKMFDCFEYKNYKKEELIEKYVFASVDRSNIIQPIIDEKITDIFKMSILNAEGDFSYKNKGSYEVIVVAEGTGILDDGINQFSVKKGDRFFLEAETESKINSANGLKLIICSQ